MKSNPICSLRFQTLTRDQKSFVSSFLLVFPHIPSCGRLWEDPRNAELGAENSRARLGPKSAGEGGVVRMGQDQDVEVGAVGWNTGRVEG